MIKYFRLATALSIVASFVTYKIYPGLVGEGLAAVFMVLAGIGVQSCISMKKQVEAK